MPVRSGRGRHRSDGSRRAAQRPTGPVTAAIRLARTPQTRPRALALRAWPALPALALLRPALAGSPLLGDYAGKVLGFDATLCLVATLLVTPLVAVARVNIAKLRWWYGMWMFTLGAAGLAVTLSVPPGSLAERAAGTAVNWTGTLIVVLLLPAAATSNAAAQKALGPEWKRWQRGVVWAVWALVAGHLLLLRDWHSAAGLALATGPLIVMRQRTVRRKVKDWRRGGYSTGALWVLLALGAAVTLCGLLVLLAGEAEAVARALTLYPGA